MLRLAIDLHTHTKFSFDSITSPENLIKAAIRKELRAIAVTDHGTIRGSNSTIEYVQKHKIKILVVKGVEFFTTLGDIIGLFIEEMIRSHDIFDVIDKIKEQDGLALFPHPYVSHNPLYIEEIAKKCHIIEVWNSRATFEENRKAYRLAKSLNKPMLGNSDAHLARDVGRGQTLLEDFSTIDELRSLLLKRNNDIRGYYTPKISFDFSKFVQILKLRKTLIPRKTIGFTLYNIKALLQRENNVL